MLAFAVVRIRKAKFVSALSFHQLEAVRQLGVCATADAIAAANVRLRNEGFCNGSIQCLTANVAHLPPVMGYAVTARIQCSAPPSTHHHYVDRLDWLNYLLTLPQPRIVVMEDADPREPGAGAYWDLPRAQLHARLGCQAVVTNGSVREVAEIGALGLPIFAAGTAVSRAYAHIVEFGIPVHVAGLNVKPGDLIQADRDGVQSVPLELVPELPRLAAENRLSRQRLLAACRDPQSSVQSLLETLKDLP